MPDINTFDKNKIELMPVFFIIGRGRSGTTLSRFLFDAHPNISIPFEHSFLIYFYPKYGKIKIWNKEKLISFYEDLEKAGLFYFWTINKEKCKNDLLACEGKTSYSTICKTVYFNYKSFYKKEEILLLGDKNTIYDIFVKDILKIFPEAKFIHLVRDYRDNIFSMRKIRMEAPIIASLAYRWKYSCKNVINFKKKYPNQFLSVKYENLANNTSETLKEICKFLNIEYYPSVLDFYKKYDEMKKLYPEDFVNHFFKSLFKPITTVSVDKWKESMTEREIITADTIVGNCAEETGYQRKYTNINVLIYILNLPGIFYGWLYSYLIYAAIMYRPFWFKPFALWNKILRNKTKLLYKEKISSDSFKKGNDAFLNNIKP